MPTNPNRYSDVRRSADDIPALMRDINALEGFKADQTLTTSLDPQYGIILGTGANLTSASDIACDSSGNIYILCPTRIKIVKLTRAGNYVSEFGTAGASPGELQGPVAMSIDSSDNVWVLDTTRMVIIKFNTSGTYQSEFDVSTESPIGGLDTPSDGYIYAGITSGVVKYNTTGILQATYSDATITIVSDIAVDVTNGYIYVACYPLLSDGRPVRITVSGPSYTQIGTVGSGAGNFQKPYGVCLDHQANALFVDGSRKRVIVYNSSLTYQSEFGSSGTGTGQFNAPVKPAIAIDGSILISDNSRNLILRFRGPEYSSPVFLADYYPTGVGADGYLLGAYKLQSNHALAKLNSSPALVTSIALGGLTDQRIATTDSSGYIYARYYLSPYDKIHKYPPTGGSSPTTTISVGEQIFSIVCDGTDIWAGTSTHIYKYSTSGSLLNTITIGSNISWVRLWYYSGVIWAFYFTSYNYYMKGYNTSGTLLYSYATANPSVYDMIRFMGTGLGTLDGTYQYAAFANYMYVGAIGSTSAKYSWALPTSVSGTSTPYYSAPPIYFSGYLYITATNTSGNIIGTVRVAAPGTYTFINEMPDASSPTISSPTDVAADSTNLWITDTNNHRVLKYNKAGGYYVTSFGSSGSGDGQFSSPKGIALDSSGNAFVVDTGNSRVQKFNSSGTYQSKFGSAGSGDGQFSSPSYIHIDASDNIYVTDTGNSRVQVFNSAGTFLRKFGTSGSSNGNLSTPYGVSKNPVTGHVYVVNSANNRMEVFYEFNATTAKYVSRWGESGSSSTARQFSSPQGVATDAAGHMWVSDTGNNRLARISSRGRLNTYYGSSGSGDGQFSSPKGMDIYGNELYVVDSGNNRIHKFLLDESTLDPSTTQTSFVYYMSGQNTDSMGAVDRGVHVPPVGGLVELPTASDMGENIDTYTKTTKYVEDMRRAVERLSASGVFTNTSDGTLYDWSSSTTNLYHNAMSGKHAMYGEDATVGAAKRTWTRGALRGKKMLDIDMGEVYETVKTLKNATWGVVT